MKLLLSCFTLFLTLFNNCVSAEELDTIVVSSKTDEASSKLSSSHIIIDSEEIEGSQYTNLTDLLARKSGVDFSQTGVFSGQSALYIRGGESRHVVIVIDGVKVYDPTSIGRDFDLNLLDLSQIERVEVLKGSHSVMYGSDAVAGVIHIQTKKGSAKSYLDLEFGAKRKGAISQSVSLSEKTLLSLGGFYSETEPTNIILYGSEKDKSIARGGNLSFLFEGDKLESTSSIKFNSSFDEVDGTDGDNNIPFDSDSDYSKKSHLVVQQELTYNIKKDHRITVNLSHNHHQRANRSTYFSSGSATTSDRNYTGTANEIEARYFIKKDKYNFTLGLSETKESYLDNETSEIDFKSQDLFSQVRFLNKNSTTTIGSRGVNADEFGTHFIYELSHKQLLGSFFVTGIHSTGFKSPSTYQLYGSATQWGPVGNDELTPEKLTSYEIIFGKEKGELHWSFSFFYNEVDDFIDYGASGYDNLEKNITRGGEFSFSKVGKTQSFGLNFLGVNHDLSTGKDPQRKPSFTTKSFYQYKLTALSNIKVHYSHVSDRYEYVGGERKTLTSYSLLDFDYQYEFSNQSIVVSVKNLFDESYELARGYEVLGRNLSLKYQYRY